MTTQWNFADIWEAIADRFPQEAAQECDGAAQTWHEFDGRADAVATEFLAHGLSRQSKIAQFLYNGIEYLESMFAAFKVGMVPVNTNYRYVEQELQYLWDNADVEAVVFHADFVDRCDRLRPQMPNIRLWLYVGPDSDCPQWAVSYERVANESVGRVRAPWGRSGQDLCLLYTGGTTGMPKGVMWPQHELASMLDAQGSRQFGTVGDAIGLAASFNKIGPRVLPLAPLMHGTAAWFAMTALQSAGTVVTMSAKRFDAASVLDVIVERSIKGICIVGDAFARPLLEELRAAPQRWALDGLRVVVSSGAMFSPEVKDELLGFAPRATIVDSLGTSESGAMGKAAGGGGETPSIGRFRVGPNVLVIGEDGQVVTPGSGVSGRLAVGGNIPLGYYKDETKTAATFLTIGDRRYVVAGDWAEVELDGTLRLLGRGSGCINTGGEKVFPEEVEEALKRHVDVIDAAVVGRPDERLGQRVVAVVQLRSGTTTDPAVLIAHAREQLAGYKVPKEITFVDDLRRAPNGKLDYRHLAEVAGNASGS